MTSRGVARGMPEVPGHPLGQKMSEGGGGTELKNYSQELKFFSLAGTPLSIFLATPLTTSSKVKASVRCSCLLHCR